MEILLLYFLGLDFFFFLSVIAYSVIMGALMASGKEVSGKIPKGKASIKIHWFSLNGGSHTCTCEEGAVRMNKSCTLLY